MPGAALWGINNGDVRSWPGAPGPSGSQRHSPEDKKGVTESFWKSHGGVEHVLQPLHRRELGPVWARLTWRSSLGRGRGEHAVNRRMVAEGQQRAWGCQTRQAGSGRWTNFSSPWLGPGHSASHRAAIWGPGLTLPRMPGTAGAPQPLVLAF